MLPLPAAAHGLGGRSDLPVPIEYFLVGALVVLLLSFGALAILWPDVRLQDGPRYRGQGWRPPRLVAGIVAGLGVATLLLVLAAGLGGDADARSMRPRSAGCWPGCWCPFSVPSSATSGRC
jgi:hypothetical protein